MSLVFASNSFPPISIFLHLSSYSYILPLFFLTLFVPSIPHNYFNHCLISCCLFSIYVFFLPSYLIFHPLPSLLLLCYLFPLFLSHSSVRLISFSFILPSFLHFLPSFFSSAVRVFVVSIRLSFLRSSVLLFASVFSVYSVASYFILLSFLATTFIHCLFTLRCYFTTAYQLCNVHHYNRPSTNNSTTPYQLFPLTVAAAYKNRPVRDANRCPLSTGLHADLLLLPHQFLYSI